MKISIVIPVYYNRDNLEPLYQDIKNKIIDVVDYQYEIVMVDDGSLDDSFCKMQELAAVDSNIKIYHLSRNFGSHAAIRAGLTLAGYGICTWMGSDLQEPLELLEKSFRLIDEEGYDAVYVCKRSIAVSRMNRAFSKTYSHLMQKYAVSNYSSDGVSTIVFNEKIKNLLNDNVEGNSSIMLQIIDAGFRTVNLEMDFHERSAGKSKWTFSKKVKLMIDSFVAFSFAPIRLVSILGMIMLFVGAVVGIVTIVTKILNYDTPAGYEHL